MAEYIERKQALNVLNLAEFTFDDKNKLVLYADSVDMCLLDIPSADVQPVVHGHLTNADRIRAMTDEELASYITGVWYSFEELPGMCDVCESHTVQKCSECWLDWLKQEVKDG